MQPPVFFIPITASALSRTGSASMYSPLSPGRGSSNLAYDPNNNNSPRGASPSPRSPTEKLDSFEHAQHIIRGLRKEIHDLETKCIGLSSLMARGPGILGERIKHHEQRQQELEEMARSRSAQTITLGEALRTELDVSCQIKDEGDRAIASTAQQLDDALQFAQRIGQVNNADLLNLQQLVSRYVATSTGMAQLIADQTARIHEQEHEINHFRLKEINHAKVVSNMDQMASTLRKETGVLTIQLATAEERGFARSRADREEMQKQQQMHDQAMEAAHSTLRMTQRELGRHEDASNRYKQQGEALQQQLKDEQAAHMKLRQQTQEQADVAAKQHQSVVELIRSEYAQQLASGKRANDELTVERDALLRSVADKDHELKKLGTDLAERTAEKLQLQLAKKEQDVELEQLAARHSSTRSELVKAQAQLTGARQALIKGGDAQERQLVIISAELEEGIREAAQEKALLEEKVGAEDSKINALRKELESMSSASTSRTATSSLSEDRRTALQRAIEEHEKSRQKIKSEIERLDGVMERQRRELEALRKSRDAKDLALEVATKRLDEVQRTLETEKRELLAASTETKAKLLLLTEQKTKVESERQAIEDELTRLSQRSKKTFEELAAARAALENSQQEQLDSVRKALQGEMQRHQEERERLHAELLAKHRQMEELRISKEAAEATARAKAAHVLKVQQEMEQREAIEKEKQQQFESKMAALEKDAQLTAVTGQSKLFVRQKMRWATILDDVMLPAERRREKNLPAPFQSQPDDDDMVRQLDHNLSKFRDLLLERVDDVRANAQGDAERRALAVVLQNQRLKFGKIVAEVDEIFGGGRSLKVPSSDSAAAAVFESEEEKATLEILDTSVANFRTELLKRVASLQEDQAKRLLERQKQRLAALLADATTPADKRSSSSSNNSTSSASVSADDDDTVRSLDQNLSKFRVQLLEQVDDMRTTAKRDLDRRNLSVALHNQREKFREIMADVEEAFGSSKSLARTASLGPAAATAAAAALTAAEDRTSLEDLDTSVANFRTELLKRVASLQEDQRRTRDKDERKRIAAALKENKRNCEQILQELDDRYTDKSSSSLSSSSQVRRESSSTPPSSKNADALLEDTASLDKFDKQLAAAKAKIWNRLDELITEERKRRIGDDLKRAADLLYSQQTACDASLLELDVVLAIPSEHKRRQEAEEMERKKKEQQQQQQQQSPETLSAEEEAAAAARAKLEEEEAERRKPMAPVRTKEVAASVDDLSRELRFFCVAHSERALLLRSALQERCTEITELEGRLAEEIKAHASFREIIHLSREFHDQADISELRRQLASTKAALTNLMRMDMMRHEQEVVSKRKGSPLPAVGGAFAGAASDSVSRSRRNYHHQDEDDNNNNDNDNDPSSSPPVGPPQQLPPGDPGLTSGSFLDIDTMKEMTRMRWTVAKETWCPEGVIPTTEDIFQRRLLQAQQHQQHQREPKMM